MAPKTSHFLEGKRIIVAGGGIAGSTFVAALSQLWDQSLKKPDVIIFEKHGLEASLQQDPYMLTINGGSKDEGLVALQQLGLLADIQQHSTLNDGVIRVWSDNWTQLATIDPKPFGSLPAATMRVQRQELKRILVEKAVKTSATWRWACTCTSAERLANGQIRVTITDSEAGRLWTEDCDLLIAADGANSNIRGSILPQEMKLEYAGATQIGGVSNLPGGLPKPIHEDYGLQMSSGKGVCCIYTPFDKNTIGWAISREGPERQSKTGSFTPEEAGGLIKEALKTGSMFNDPFETVLKATDPASVFIRPAKERRPLRHSTHLRGVAFIGDANHELNCYVLNGANLALKDGWDLAEQLCRNASMETAVASFDRLSIPRTDHDMNFSHERIRFGHSTGMMWKVYKYGMAAQRALKK